MSAGVIMFLSPKHALCKMKSKYILCVGKKKKKKKKQEAREQHQMKRRDSAQERKEIAEIKSKISRE